MSGTLEARQFAATDEGTLPMRTSLRQPSLAALALIALAAGSLFAAGAQRRAEAQVAVAVFASTPVFDARGTAFAVFGGGTIAQLEAVAEQVGASGVWVQDGAGTYQLLVVKGPSFLTAPFTTAFSGGFTSATAVTLVRTPGGASTPAPSPVATATPTPVPAVTGFDQQVAAQAFTGTNVQRATNGLGALTRNSLLDQSAAAYAKVVFDRDPYLAGPANPHELDGQPWDRATRVGYQWAAFYENLSALSGGTLPSAGESAQRTVTGWMESPGHRANILRPDTAETGVGCYSGRAAAARAGLEQVLICVAVYADPK